MTTLKEEEPFAYVVNNEKLTTTCSFCFAQPNSLNRCTGCHVLYYCNRNCQKNDWVNHKKECLLLRKVYDETSGKVVLPANIRLVARVLLKSETSRAQKAFNGRSWEDLNDDLLPMTDEMAPFYDQQITCIVHFLKPRKIVNAEDAISAFHKILNHNLDIFDSDEGLKTVGMGIYLGLSIHKHSCHPNSQLLFTGKKARLRSFDEETVYSPALTVSYTGFTPDFLHRKDGFSRKYFFDCTCPICTDENHIVNRMGSSCRVTCCKDAAGILDENGSLPYRCNKCGIPNDITVDEVKRAEAKIVEFLEQNDTPCHLVKNFNFPATKSIVLASEKVISIFNFRYMNLCDKVVGLTRATGQFDGNTDVQRMCRHVFDEKLKGRSYNLPDTHRFLTSSLMDRAGFKFSLIFGPAAKTMSSQKPKEAVVVDLTLSDTDDDEVVVLHEIIPKPPLSFTRVHSSIDMPLAPQENQISLPSSASELPKWIQSSIEENPEHEKDKIQRDKIGMIIIESVKLAYL